MNRAKGINSNFASTSRWSDQQKASINPYIHVGIGEYKSFAHLLWINQRKSQNIVAYIVDCIHSPISVESIPNNELEHLQTWHIKLRTHSNQDRTLNPLEPLKKHEVWTWLARIRLNPGPNIVKQTEVRTLPNPVLSTKLRTHLNNPKIPNSILYTPNPWTWTGFDSTLTPMLHTRLSLKKYSGIAELGIEPTISGPQK